MNKIQFAWLPAALLILLTGAWSPVQAGAAAPAPKNKAAAPDAKAQLDAFTQRAEAWANGEKVFTDDKYERWEKHFKSEAEFKAWLPELFPDFLEQEKKREGNGEGPMDDSAFENWMTAKVLSKISSKSLFELLSSGGVLMVPLLICSIVGVTFAMLRAFEYRRDVLFPASFMEGLKSRLAESVESGRAYCADIIENNRHLAPAGRICAAGLKEVDEGKKAVAEAVESAGVMEVDRLKRGLRVLQVVIAVAPLLGLVGTVYGMIGSFQSVEMAQEGDDKAKMLSGGIYEALVTTATGLTIAIPMMIVYHFLNTKVDALSEDFNGLAGEFMKICPPNGGDDAAAELAEDGDNPDKEEGEPEQGAEAEKETEPAVVA